MIITPQMLAVAGTVIAFLCGIGVSRGVISQETATYLTSQETMTFLGSTLTAIVAVVLWWKNRPKAVVAAAGNIVAPSGGYVVAPAKIANSSATPDNVITADQAATMVAQSPVPKVADPTIIRP